MSQLPPVHAALCGRDLVILDLQEDAYQCLPGTEASWRSGELRRALRESFGRPDGPVPDVALPGSAVGPALRGGLGDLPPSRLRPRDLRDLLIALHRLKALGPDPTLRACLEGLSAARPPSRLPPPPEPRASSLAAAAAVLDQVLPWLPGRWLCLRRSALTMIFLRARGLDADWVFGVRTWPFEAHCWVEGEGLCLTDDHERVRVYSPILRLRAARI